MLFIIQGRDVNVWRGPAEEASVEDPVYKGKKEWLGSGHDSDQSMHAPPEGMHFSIVKGADGQMKLRE